MKTSEVLLRAANLIEERGWVQGPGGWPGYGGEHAIEGLCLEGGLMAALGETFDTSKMGVFWNCPAYRAVEAYLDRPRREEVGGDLWRWNDAPEGRTAEEVVTTLRAAALVETIKEAPEFVIPAPDEAWLRLMAGRFGLEPVRVGDHLYVTRPLPGLSEALVYSARVEVDAR